jgi:hypothetical protein
MNANLFSGCKTPSEVEQRYQELFQVFKPLDNGETNEMIDLINDEYSKLREVLNKSAKVEANKEKATVSEKLKELQGKINPEGLHFELCGSWLWISGKTYQVKGILKELGFRYSDNKLSWYYRQEDHRSSSQKPIPMDLIREKFGTSEVVLK